MTKKSWLQWEVGETTNLEGWKYKRTELLYSQRKEAPKNKLLFNITCYPIFSKLNNILLEIHLFLTLDKEHSKIFENIPIMGFKKEKSLKGILVRAKIPPLKTKESFCGPCNKSRFEISKRIPKKHQFESTSTKRIYSIKSQNLNCSSKM